MKKVIIIGPDGAGKSTFATALGAISEMPVIHLDKLYWKPGWQKPSKEQWRETVSDVVQRDAWIMDGNSRGVTELRMDACDTVIFLDRSRWVCLWNVLKRCLMYRRRPRPGMTEGCPEHLSWDFLQWVWTYPRRTKPETIAKIEKHAADKNVVVLKSRTEMKMFLDVLSQFSLN